MGEIRHSWNFSTPFFSVRCMAHASAEVEPQTTPSCDVDLASAHEKIKRRFPASA